MSGHSHWATIKHKKSLSDARKGKMFSKVSRLLMIAAREGGSDPSTNLKLQYAMQQAREINMPKENVERAIKKGANELGGTSYESAIFEGYGPGGVAIMVDVLTDNKNRTAHEIRKIFENHGGSLGSVNCVNWMFSRKGLITVPSSDVKEDQLMQDALDVGADDVELAGDVYEITCSRENIDEVKKKLQEKKYQIRSSEITLIPQNYVNVDEQCGKKLLAFMNALDEHDDVQNVAANFELPKTLTTDTDEVKE